MISSFAQALVGDVCSILDGITHVLAVLVVGAEVSLYFKLASWIVHLAVLLRKPATRIVIPTLLTFVGCL